MTWLTNLLKMKGMDTSESGDIQSKIKWEVFDFFEKGEKSYFNKQSSDALANFDLALQNGFEEYFNYNLEKLYDMRGACLQEMDYHFDAIEDFNKAICLSPNDCNKYFPRSFSKSAIFDFEGQIADLEKAIELSKEDNELNRVYDDEAKKIGHRYGITQLFQSYLNIAVIGLESELYRRREIENATTPEAKARSVKFYNDFKEKRLSGIKRRNELNLTIKTPSDIRKEELMKQLADAKAEKVKRGDDFNYMPSTNSTKKITLSKSQVLRLLKIKENAKIKLAELKAEEQKNAIDDLTSVADKVPSAKIDTSSENLTTKLTMEQQGNYRNPNMAIAVKIILIACFIGCTFHMPYNYYQIVRFISFIGFGYLLYYYYTSKLYFAVFISLTGIILYNPIIAIVFDRETWQVIDKVSILVLVLWVRSEGFV